jgi:hypothetical protein
VFLSIETYLAGEISIQKNFDRGSNLKIFLLPGLEAQKVEKHCSRSGVAKVLPSKDFLQPLFQILDAQQLFS